MSIYEDKIKWNWKYLLNKIYFLMHKELSNILADMTKWRSGDRIKRFSSVWTNLTLCRFWNDSNPYDCKQTGKFRQMHK